MTEQDKRYIDTFINPLYECLTYKPKMGNSQNRDGYSLEDFLNLYGSDPFYSWIGLDSPYMYTAHKAAGCMTSIYRQIGTGCERLFRSILCDTTGYVNEASSLWSYETTTKAGKKKILSLDGRLELEDIVNDDVRIRVAEWIEKYAISMGVSTDLRGAVFEVRQGYKSKDSKRQNGDIDNVTVAYAYKYLPVITVFSSQIDNDIVLRYKNNKSAIIVGNNCSDPNVSLFAFCKEILGYDIANFFQSNSGFIKSEVHSILEKVFGNNEGK